MYILVLKVLNINYILLKILYNPVFSVEWQKVPWCRQTLMSAFSIPKKVEKEPEIQLP